MHEFSTTAGGELWQRSIAGSIQGLGTDVLLVDDPFGSPKDAESIKSRDDAWNWFFGALSRVENEGIVILCTTRWWGDDLYGRLQAGYADTDSTLWEFISLPAIATEDGDAVGRKKGEALWPGKRMLEELQILERTMPLADWARGYQQIILEDLGIGRCYPDYDPGACLQPGEWDYESPIHVGIDFNADPMSGEIFMVSKVPLPGWTNQFETVARGLDEVIVETTEMSVFAEALMGRLKEIAAGFRMRVTMHCDQTSNRKVVGLREGDTAVSILKREVARCKSSLIAVEWRDIGSNPGVFKRVDTVDSMLKRRDLKIDPKQVELAKDFKFVCWKLDKANRRVTIDKARDRPVAMPLTQPVTHSLERSRRLLESNPSVFLGCVETEFHKEKRNVHREFRKEKLFGDSPTELRARAARQIVLSVAVDSSNHPRATGTFAGSVH
jgi:hypothetical protein